MSSPSHARPVRLSAVIAGLASLIYPFCTTFGGRQGGWDEAAATSHRASLQLDTLIRYSWTSRSEWVSKFVGAAGVAPKKSEAYNKMARGGITSHRGWIAYEGLQIEPRGNLNLCHQIFKYQNFPRGWTNTDSRRRQQVSRFRRHMQECRSQSLIAITNPLLDIQAPICPALLNYNSFIVPDWHTVTWLVLEVARVADKSILLLQFIKTRFDKLITCMQIVWKIEFNAVRHV